MYALISFSSGRIERDYMPPLGIHRPSVACSKQREMVKPSNDLDWIHFLCWALLSSAMCNVWENRLIFMILLVKLQRSHDEKTDSVISLFCFNWATNSCQTNLMQIKAFKDFSSIRYQFLFLEMQSTLFTNLIYTIR